MGKGKESNRNSLLFFWSIFLMKYSARFTLTQLREGAAYVGQDVRWVMLPLQGGHRFDTHLQT